MRSDPKKETAMAKTGLKDSTASIPRSDQKRKEVFYMGIMVFLYYFYCLMVRCFASSFAICAGTESDGS